MPFEGFSYQFSVDSDDYGLVVIHYGGDAPAWIQVVVWGTYIEHYTRNGSITNPAESANPGMLAVGAAHWNDVHTIEPYSSRGPTPDGRVKPDVVGADCGVTARSPLDEYNDGFCGTSQAAPHVAGMAALVRQRFPSYTPAEVASYLERQRGAEAEPGSQRHLGARFRPTSRHRTGQRLRFQCRPMSSLGTRRRTSTRWPTLPIGRARHLVRPRDEWVTDLSSNKIYATI